MLARAKVNKKFNLPMYKSEIFNKTLQIVSEETEISVESMLSKSKEADVVDARYLLVYSLYQQGFYPSQIACKINKTKRAVNYMISHFDNRMESGKMMRIQKENIGKRTGSN